MTPRGIGKVQSITRRYPRDNGGVCCESDSVANREQQRVSWPQAHRWGAGLCLWLACLILSTAIAPAARAVPTVRVVCYNIEADTGGYTAPRNGLYTVLEAIGQVPVEGAPHPLDLLALEETTSNAATVAPIVNTLNAYYGGQIYAAVTFQATQRGSAGSGNGPGAMVYNTMTVQPVPQPNGAQAAGVPGTPTSGSGGAPRQVVRYQFRPVGSGPEADFYVYVSHMKSSASGDPATNAASRNTEARLIHADLLTLPANSSVLSMGDFNMDGSTEAAYQTLTASDSAQLIDPLNYPQDNTQTWNTAAFLPILTESATSLRYRDDLQFMSPAVYNGKASLGLHYVPGSHRAFGNNGSVALYGSVNQSGNTALATLPGPITASAALAALVTASDHLPVMADYTVGTPYGSWVSRHFDVAGQTDPAVSGEAADPDGDGISNLLEYALNLDPHLADVTGLPTGGLLTGRETAYLTLTYTKTNAATDLTYTPQVSGDLVSWQSGADAVETVLTTDNGNGLTQIITVRDKTPLTDGGRRFMRLLVTRP